MSILRVFAAGPQVAGHSSRSLSKSFIASQSASVSAAVLVLVLAVGTTSVSRAASITGAAGAAGSNGTTGNGGAGGDGGGAPGSGGAGAVSNTGGAGAAGTNGNGGGGGGGGLNLTFSPLIYPNGGAGGGSDFGTGGAGGTVSAPARGGGEEAGGGGALGASASTTSGGGGGGGGGRGTTISTGTATIQGADTVTGGTGGSGGAGVGTYGDSGGGGGGGIGVVFTGTSLLTVNGTVAGGSGGAGGSSGGSGTFGGGGGAGGSGLRATQNSATVLVNGTVLGGNGGSTGMARYNQARTVAGAGGAGLIVPTLVNNGTISGGNGGVGADGVPVNGGGAAGGAGGIGAQLTAATASSNAAAASIQGGNGGAGGNAGAGSGDNGGNGGAGGTALSLTAAGASFTNLGNITGGRGGVGGAGGSYSGSGGGNGGNGGSGGVGVSIAGATLINLGMIVGGAGAAGGAGGTGSPNGPAGTDGAGGAGVSGSNVTLINAGSISGGLASDGVTRANAVSFTGGTNILELRAGSTITGNVVGTGSDTLALGGAANSAFDVSTIGPSQQYRGFSLLQKTGISTWTVTGTQTATAAWAVNAGVLLVNGDISASSGIIVNAGGTLGGIGTVGTTTIASGGTLAPGNSIGTITVNGNLIFQAGSNYNIEVSATAADRTNVTGTANLAGNVNATFAPGAYTTPHYTILNAGGGVAGQFDALNAVGTPAALSAALSYDANNVYLNLTLNFAQLGGLNANQQNVANALTGSFIRNGGVATPFTTLTTGGLSQVSGESGASVQQTVWTGANLFMTTVFDNGFAGGNGTPGAQSGAALAYAPQRQPSAAAREAYAAVTPRERAATFEQRWMVWAAGYGGSARVSGDSITGSNDTTSRVYGAAAGATWRPAPDTALGFALGGDGSNFSVGQGLGTGQADGFKAALYGRHEFGSRYLAAALAYGWQDASTDRTVSAGGVTNALHASFHPQTLTTRLEGGQRLAWPLVNLSPYAAVQTTTLFMPSYAETMTAGAGLFALSYASRDVTATRGEIGARFDKAALIGDLPLVLKGRLAWAHDWNNAPTVTATLQQLPGASFVVNGARPAADSALVSLGATLALARGWSASTSFDGEFSRTTASYAGKGSLRFAW
ncbi:autotransporter domain-containing protein [Bradyrhizobium diazoefficiens]|nr:autotransporter outer membrane beta-barrel domain-containing protein [Bradyrhizobium diazoefficiens]MBR0966687.1 autotransporter domain-containing protein [Bradyrhizobium diazoefficiens]MBR0980199.1 autotransporter domain-containing protein [Bradyrhizobium diazoefficiens]MBR1009547.1 autotransporter domain-containing protein [Bradyrhizobium diazoefficiens]MBR1016130.1 autotransporter domain-containing protein [Bradyrhizobium diazoefficiens]MBR1053508.1 autotransporter domain-containing prot